MGVPFRLKTGVVHKLILPIRLFKDVHIPSKVPSSGSDVLLDRRLSRSKLRARRESLLSTLLVGDVRCIVAEDGVPGVTFCFFVAERALGRCVSVAAGIGTGPGAIGCGAGAGVAAGATGNGAGTGVAAGKAGSSAIVAIGLIGCWTNAVSFASNSLSESESSSSSHPSAGVKSAEESGISTEVGGPSVPVVVLGFLVSSASRSAKCSSSTVLSGRSSAVSSEEVVFNASDNACDALCSSIPGLDSSSSGMSAHVPW